MSSSSPRVIIRESLNYLLKSPALLAKPCQRSQMLLQKVYTYSVTSQILVLMKLSLAALNNTALNIVCNQEYAQAVPHVTTSFKVIRCRYLYCWQAHYHIIPAPRAPDEAPVAAPLAPLSQKEMHRLEFHARQELDDDEAEDLCVLIRSKL